MHFGKMDAMANQKGFEILFDTLLRAETHIVGSGFFAFPNHCCGGAKVSFCFVEPRPNITR